MACKRKRRSFGFVGKISANAYRAALVKVQKDDRLVAQRRARSVSKRRRAISVCVLHRPTNTPIVCYREGRVVHGRPFAGHSKKRAR